MATGSQVGYLLGDPTILAFLQSLGVCFHTLAEPFRQRIGLVSKLDGTDAIQNFLDTQHAIVSAGEEVRTSQAIRSLLAVGHLLRSTFSRLTFLRAHSVGGLCLGLMQDQIYGMFNEADSDDDGHGRGRRERNKDFSVPVAFVSSGETVQPPPEVSFLCSGRECMCIASHLRKRSVRDLLFVRDPLRSLQNHVPSRQGHFVVAWHTLK